MKQKFIIVSAFTLFSCSLGWADSPASTAATATTTTSGSISIKAIEEPRGYEIYIGDKLFAGYRVDQNGTPIVYPILSSAGLRMTRDFPMKEGTKNEKFDHDHHRSLWFNHGEVNGIDFWIDDAGSGKIVQKSISTKTSTTSVNSAQTAIATIQTTNDWVGPDGKLILSDSRQFTFHESGSDRIIDCDIILKASEGDVHFGDTKEGSFGIRVPGSMKVDAKLGGKIVNAEGLVDGKAWGKRSNWVNYSGPIATEGGEMTPAGITILYHPSSFESPCRWHVRTYGLFAANPFGVYHFDGGKKTEGVKLKKGEEIEIKCRVIFSDGEFDTEKIEKAWKEYAK